MKKGGFGPLFCSAICGRCHRERIQDVAPQGGLMLSQSKKSGAGGSPPRCAGWRGCLRPLASRPPRPRYLILRRPRRQRRGAPARRPCGGRAACVSRRRPDLVGGVVPPPLVRCGVPPASYGGRGVLCRWWGPRRGRGRRPWPDRSAPLHFRPRAASPAPLRPLCACGRGNGDSTACGRRG